MRLLRKEQREQEGGSVNQIAAFITIPFVLAVPPVVGLFIGKFLDSLFGTGPYLMYLMLSFGFIAGCREFYRLVKKYGSGE